MSRILCGIFAVALCFIIGGQLGEALMCNSCAFGILGRCVFGSTVECSAAQPNCYTGEAKFPTIPGFMGFSSRGCLDSAPCNMTINGTVLGFRYTATRTCCATNLCNGADSVHLSLTAALSAALVASVWSSWQY